MGRFGRTGFTRWLREKHHRGRYEIMRRLVADRARRPLEVGCGPPCETMQDGSFLRFLGYGLGTDVERRSVPFPFVQGDIKALPFRRDAFEVVTCIEIIEHVHHPTAALDELARVLADRGTLILTTPNNHFFFRLIWFLWEHFAAGMWAHTHVYSLNRRGWLRVMREHGRFAVTDVKNYWGINLIMHLEKRRASRAHPCPPCTSV